MIRGRVRHGRHVQREPAHDGRARARRSIEVLTPDVYEQFDRIDKVMKDGLSASIEKYELPCYVSGLGAKGSVIYSKQPVREYRDAVGIDERISYLAWLFQQNRGVFKSPWTKQETWTLSVAHTRGRRAALHRQLRGVRRGGHRLKLSSRRGSVSADIGPDRPRPGRGADEARDGGARREARAEPQLPRGGEGPPARRRVVVVADAGRRTRSTSTAARARTSGTSTATSTSTTTTATA